MAILKFKDFINEKISLKLIPKPTFDCEERIAKFKKANGAIGKAINTIVFWWQGRFMGVGDDEAPQQLKTAEICFREISKLYHQPKEDKVYRVVHLRTELTTEKDIQQITNGEISNKRLQSWSRTKEGAQYFFKESVKSLNHMANPELGKAWVIIESNDVEILLTYEEMMQFMVDFNKVEPELANYLRKVLADDYLTPAAEVICVTKSTKIDFKIVDILVLPGETNMDGEPENA